MPGAFGELDAGAFAFVMATGIVSVAASLQGLRIVSDALLAIACAGWILLAVAVSRRGLRSRRPRLRSFAVVAATAVIGSRLALAGIGLVPLALWALACVLWLGLLLWRPALGDLGGAALLVVVATESLAVLAAMVAHRRGAFLLGAALAAWALGLLLYPLVAGLVSATFLRGGAFTPDLWIVMGALAIATLAGTDLLVAARSLHTLAAVRGWLPDADLATWALASSLVPLLVAAELRVRRAKPWDAARWSFVFPLGMYSVATRTLAHAVHVPGLRVVATASFAAAAAAWTVVAAGLVRRSLT